MAYKVSYISKRNGKCRKLYIPDEKYKAELRMLNRDLEEILAKLDVHKVNYAFQKGRNCVLHAMQHLGQKYTLTIDVEDFFDNISTTHVKGLIPQRIVDRCFIDGSPRQGLPTSPLVSSIAFLRCDGALIEAFKKTGLSVVYTRYADDLTFSFNDMKNLATIKYIVQQSLQRYGFNVNHSKTTLQSSDNGRVIITGVAIDSGGVHATRRTQKKLRAALHQMNYSSARGLTEWSKCKLPNAFFSP